jgi:hypothetical protein
MMLSKASFEATLAGTGRYAACTDRRGAHSMRRGPLTFSMRELSGAFGDYGTFLPFAVGYIKDQRAHPS